MLTKDQRISVGENVKNNAVHFYAGLKGISIDDAQREFEEELYRANELAVSALRLAEREVMSSIQT
jgi:hypothetical protein